MKQLKSKLQHIVIFEIGIHILLSVVLKVKVRRCNHESRPEYYRF